MTTYAWPTSDAFKPETCSVYLRPNTRDFTSQYSGATQGIDLLGERLVMALHLPVQPAAAGALREGFFNRLRGVHWISAYHFARPQPLGTQRGSLLLSSTVPQGASVLPLSGGTNGSTLLPGDMIGLGGELFQVADVATFNGSGLASVAVANRVRSRTGISVGSAVTWDRPTTTWKLTSPIPVNYRPGRIADALDLELVQVW